MLGIGRKLIYFIGCLLGAASGFVGFAFLNHSAKDTIWLTYIGLIISFGVFYGPISGGFPGLISGVFPVETRYSGISFLYQFSR